MFDVPHRDKIMPRKLGFNLFIVHKQLFDFSHFKTWAIRGNKKVANYFFLILNMSEGFVTEKLIVLLALSKQSKYNPRGKNTIKEMI